MGKELHMAQRLVFLVAAMLTVGACTRDSAQSINGPSGPIYRLSGTVRSNEPPFNAVTQAHIEVSGGAAPVWFAESDANGFFTIPGIASGPASVTISRSGYETSRESVMVNADMEPCDPVALVGEMQRLLHSVENDVACGGNEAPEER